MRFFTINLIKDILQYISSSDDPTIIHIPKIVSEVNGTLNGEKRKGNRRPTTTTVNCIIFITRFWASRSIVLNVEEIFVSGTFERK